MDRKRVSLKKRKKSKTPCNSDFCLAAFSLRLSKKLTRVAQWVSNFSFSNNSAFQFAKSVTAEVLSLTPELPFPPPLSSFVTSSPPTYHPRQPQAHSCSLSDSGEQFENHQKPGLFIAPSGSDSYNLQGLRRASFISSSAFLPARRALSSVTGKKEFPKWETWIIVYLGSVFPSKLLNLAKPQFFSSVNWGIILLSTRLGVNEN